MTDRAAVSIRPLTRADEEQALIAHSLLAAERVEFLLERVEGESWDDYVRKLDLNAHGEALEAGRVPHSFLVAEVAGRIAGRVSVRYELTPYLAEVGGHIGYGVIPEFRRQGIASALLRRGLTLLSERGIREALITCDPRNTASRRTIEAAGGAPDRSKPRAYDGQSSKLRFLVPTGRRDD